MVIKKILLFSWSKCLEDEPPFSQTNRSRRDWGEPGRETGPGLPFLKLGIGKYLSPGKKRGQGLSFLKLQNRQNTTCTWKSGSKFTSPLYGTTSCRSPGFIQLSISYIALFSIFFEIYKDHDALTLKSHPHLTPQVIEFGLTVQNFLGPEDSSYFPDPVWARVLYSFFPIDYKMQTGTSHA